MLVNHLNKTGSVIFRLQLPRGHFISCTGNVHYNFTLYSISFVFVHHSADSSSLFTLFPSSMLLLLTEIITSKL